MKSQRLFCYSLGMDRLLVSLILTMLWVALPQQENKPKEKDKTPTVYTPGGDVKPPKVVHYVEPSFSGASKEAFVDGVVKLKTTVTPEGLASDIEIVRGLNAEEDRNAIDAVKQWRFQPGTKGGEAVHVRVSIEIAFHLM